MSNLLVNKQDANMSLKGRTVLIVDGDSDSIKILEFLLESYEMQVLTASYATEALDLIQQHAVDLVISELALPDVDGCIFLKQIQSLPMASVGHLKSVALTVCALDKDRQMALESGFCQHIAKPFDLDELMQIIVQLLAEEC